VLGTTPSLNTVKLISWNYQPNKLITTVNTLRALGKERALEILRIYEARDPTDLKKNQDVEIICRFLFVRPAGWEPPTLGAAVPDTTFDGERRFSRFPIAVSNDVPFLLVAGYNVGGGGPHGWSTLMDCRELSLISKDLPTTDGERAIAAAEALTSSDAFNHLYRDQEQLAMARSFVLGQAKRVSK
jgi:hypothetical protein